MPFETPREDLLPMQGAIMFDCMLFESHALYTVDVPVRWFGPFDRARFCAALHAAAAVHDAFYMRIESIDGRWVQRYTEPVPIPVHVIGNPSGLGAYDSSLSLDPSQPPLLLVLTDNSRFDGADLVFRFHHVIADRRSIEILLEDCA